MVQDAAVEIRLATIKDIDAIIDFDNVAALDTARAKFIREQISSSACYVAIINEKVVAYGVLNYSFYHNGWIELLYVHSQFRRRGIGSLLICRMVDECRTSKLFTSTNQSNLPMQQLLAKLDFDKSGIIENLDEGDPELVYIKRPHNKTQ